ncbi:MAG: phage holin family protein [Chloroflexi bacterium]|nr:phage holin family protein [Chloroflexota bacterium]
MSDLIVKVLINAVGVFAAIKVVPQISFAFGNDWWKLLAVALILALVNSYIKPILKILSFPSSA